MHFSEPFGGVIQGARGAVLAVLLRTNAPLTGRQIHALVSPDFSLWSVQQALKSLTWLGVVDTQALGRAGVHTINEDHFFVAPLRALLDPIAALTSTLREAVGHQVETVVVFGSIARGEATAASDVDLAVIASAGWDRSTDVEDVVRTRFGNDCDVIVFTPEEFSRLASASEPVVAEILAEGVALVGSIPPAAKRGAA